MLIRESHWEKIREHFTEEEKEKLRAAVTGQAICPRGWMLDEDRLPAELREKIHAQQA